MFSQKLEYLKDKIDKSKRKKGIDAYITEEMSEESDDSFEVDEGEGKNIGGETSDPSKLIDLELINLLRYCNELKQYKENDDYQEDIMLKSIELGKKSKNKLLIFDMDETLVAAKFGNKIPQGFEATFSFQF